MSQWFDIMPNTLNMRRLQATKPRFEVLAMRSALLWVYMLFAGCAAIEQQPAPSGPIGESFHLTGRVSVKYGAEAASGRISWRHDPASDDLLISNPFGQGVARIVRNDGLVSLTTSDQKVYQARDVETLTGQVLGWRLPLAGLPDWVRGRAAADAPAQMQRDSLQRLANLRQSGWLVEFLDYGTNGLPERLRLSREDVEIRLVIDQWRAEP
ncbi:MAG: outer membrane lipoprotein LolB [Burkholderiales bacterium]|nr:outer membrane lipoprotein LolB [Burkholderiales bacterium]